MKLPRKFLVVLSIVAMACFACSDDAPGDDDGWNVGEDAGPDATSPDTSMPDTSMPDTSMPDTSMPDTDQPDAGPVDFDISFELVNESGRSVYAYPPAYGANLCSSNGYWLTLEDDDGGARMAQQCDLCECGKEDECGVCMVDCPGPLTREQAKLATGDQKVVSWDGRTWSRQASTYPDTDFCDAPQPRTGETLDATFCWGTDFDDGASEVTDVHCQTVDVELDPQRPNQVIRVLVPPPDPEPITFRMINGTDGDLYANTNTPNDSFYCSQPWYTVGDGDSTFQFEKSCGVCDCAELEQDPDAECEVACPASCAQPDADALRLGPGEERSHQWDGSIWTNEQDVSNTCQRHTVPPTNDLVATFCYADELAGTSESRYIDQTTCVDVAFDRLTDDEVVFRIE
jgi:hypothetical protein